MPKYIERVKKNWVGIALLLIVVGAFAVRFYHFDQWLYFKMDQSRDAFIVGDAVENGAGHLPLLGARVGAIKLQHGFLRLGPAYYYFQYLSGKIFHSTAPAVFAYPDLFFSVAVIPILFLFLRTHFSRRHALFVTLMYAFSFLIIQYSRFAWNPNSLQFFIILSFYGLLQFLNSEHSVHRRWWLMLWVFGITIGSQMHFFGFFSLLGISGLLILFHLRVWDRESLRSLFRKAALKKLAEFVVIGGTVVLLFYTPVIISDVMKNGQNTKNFFEALSVKADKRPLSEKVPKGLEENLNYYCLLTTSRCYQSGAQGNTPALLLTGAILLSGLFFAVRRLRVEKNQRSRDFLMLTLLWFSVFLILTMPLSFQLRPRFYIVVFALPFIFLGLGYEYLESRFGARAVLASALMTLAILVLNIHGTAQWFGEQASAQLKTTTIKRTLILKDQDGVTLGQLQGVTDWMFARHRAGTLLYYYVKPEHIRPLDYLLFSKHDKNFNYASLKITPEANVQYFAVTPAKNGLDAVKKKYGLDPVVLAQKQFGQLLVSEIDFPGRVIASDYLPTVKSDSPNDRVFWEDVFGLKGKSDSRVIDTIDSVDTAQ